MRERERQTERERESERVRERKKEKERIWSENGKLKTTSSDISLNVFPYKWIK